MTKPDVTKYESLEYWDSQWQIESHPDRFNNKKHLSKNIMDEETKMHNSHNQLVIEF